MAHPSDVAEAIHNYALTLHALMGDLDDCDPEQELHIYRQARARARQIKEAAEKFVEKTERYGQ